MDGITIAEVQRSCACGSAHGSVQNSESYRVEQRIIRCGSPNLAPETSAKHRRSIARDGRTPISASRFPEQPLFFFPLSRGRKQASEAVEASAIAFSSYAKRPQCVRSVRSFHCSAVIHSRFSTFAIVCAEPTILIHATRQQPGEPPPTMATRPVRQSPRTAKQRMGAARIRR